MLDKLLKTAEGVKGFLDGLRKNPLEIEFPRHLHIPRDAESVDIRELCDVDPDTTTPLRLVTLRANRSEEFVFTHYALFTDLEFAAEVEWFIKLNNKKILRYHGRPNDTTNPTNYLLNIGVSPDIGADALIPAYFRVKPGDVLTVDVVNRNAEVTAPIGVRLHGYLNSVNARREWTVR